MRVAKVRPEGHPWIAFDATNEIDGILQTVKELLTEVVDNDAIIIEIVDMDEEEFRNLPEFDGW